MTSINWQSINTCGKWHSLRNAPLPLSLSILKSHKMVCFIWLTHIPESHAINETFHEFMVFWMCCNYRLLFYPFVCLSLQSYCNDLFANNDEQLFFLFQPTAPLHFTPTLERDKKVVIRGKIPNKFEICCYSGRGVSRSKILPQFAYAEQKTHCSFFFANIHISQVIVAFLLSYYLLVCVRETQANVCIHNSPLKWMYNCAEQRSATESEWGAGEWGARVCECVSARCQSAYKYVWNWNSTR